MQNDPGTKPADCLCIFPFSADVNRNGTGHAPNCPAHRRIMAGRELHSRVCKFRKKPIVIEAVRWNGYNFAVIGLMSDDIFGPYGQEDAYLEIKTLEGRMRANLGDWIIKGVNGEVYPCKPDIFQKTYELVDAA